MPSIDPQIRPCHKPAPICQHIHTRRLEVVRDTESAEQGAAHPRLLDFGLGYQERVCHGCADVLCNRISRDFI